MYIIYKIKNYKYMPFVRKIQIIVDYAMNMHTNKKIYKSVLNAILKLANKYETASRKDKKIIYVKLLDYIKTLRDFKKTKSEIKPKNMKQMKNIINKIEPKEKKQKKVKPIEKEPEQTQEELERQNKFLDNLRFEQLVMSKRKLQGMNRNAIIQHPLIRIVANTDGTITNYDEIFKIVDGEKIELKLKNKYADKFNEEAKNMIIRIFKRASKNKHFNNISVRTNNVYIYEDATKDMLKETNSDKFEIRYANYSQTYSRLADFITTRNEIGQIIHDGELPRIGTIESTGLTQFIVGFTVIISNQKGNENPEKIKGEELKKLMAFAPSSNYKFNELTAVSTNDFKLCIYESFMYVLGKIEMKYKTEKLLREMNENVNKLLNEEGHEIRDAVKSGFLIQSLILLTRKYNEVIYVVYYNQNKDPFMINNGEYSEVKISEIKENRTLLYCQDDMHIAPMKQGIKRIEQTENKKERFFMMHKEIIDESKCNLDKIDGILAFDFKTESMNDYKQQIISGSIYGKHNDKIISNEFKGIDTDNKFIEYLISISTQKNRTKTRQTEAINRVNVYGFGNSSFENILMFEKVKKLIPYAKFEFSNNGIRKIEFDNVYIYDMSLYYIGKVDNILKDFGITGTNKTQNYYELANIHINNSIGKINGRCFNISKCMTSASVSMKLFNQSFQEDILGQSPEKIFKIEKSTYKGGRCDVFKSYFKMVDNKPLYYVDFNSSYPAMMRKEMPYKFIERIALNENKNYNAEFYKDTNLYLASSKYTGNDKNVINNLLGSVEGEFNYYWGCELKENILNGYEVRCKEVLIYETKIIFKSFVDYFYEKRQDAKNNGDISKVAFYKTILNNLSGKFGQKASKTCKLIKTDEINRYENISNFELIGDDNLLVSYEDKNMEQTSGKLTRIISYITSSARAELSKVMRDIGHEHIYYCDTDSIFTDKLPSSQYLDDNEIGKMKIEKVIKSACFIGKKTYCYTTIDNEEIKKTKGLESGNIEYEDLVNLGTGKIENIKSTTDMKFKSLSGGVFIKPQERTIRVK